MIRTRALIDIEFAIDEDRYKAARLARDETGVSDVTEEGVCDAISVQITEAPWLEKGLIPQRSIVTIRASTSQGDFAEVVLPSDPGVGSP